MKKIRETIWLWLFFLTSSSWGATTVVKPIDTIKNTTGGSSLSVPSVGTTFDTDSNTNTLTNKSISGSTNTLTNISLTASVTGILPVANGGTGASSLTANNVILGNGTSAVTFVAPGTSGNVLTSNGTTWTSAAATGGGTATQETPTGACNGSNTSFTLANTPTSNASVSLYQSGLILVQGAGKDYTISSSTITLTTACADGQNLYAVYSH